MPQRPLSTDFGCNLTSASHVLPSPRGADEHSWKDEMAPEYSIIADLMVSHAHADPHVACSMRRTNCACSATSRGVGRGQSKFFQANRSMWQFRGRPHVCMAKSNLQMVCPLARIFCFLPVIKVRRAGCDLSDPADIPAPEQHHPRSFLLKPHFGTSLICPRCAPLSPSSEFCHWSGSCSARPSQMASTMPP